MGNEIWMAFGVWEIKLGWLLMHMGRSSFPISLPAAGREEQVVPIAGRYITGICRGGNSGLGGPGKDLVGLLRMLLLIPWKS